MLPRLQLSRKDIENDRERYLRNLGYALRNSPTNRNVSYLIHSARNLKCLKKNEIIDDETFHLGIANIISRFIIEEVSDRVSSVILKSFISDSLGEMYRDLEKG